MSQWPHDPTERDQIASDWMHRGIDLLTATSPAEWKEAVRCFDRAITLRGALPLSEHARHGYLLAGGWIHRGDALARLAGTEDPAEAIASYDRALELLRSLPLADDPLYPRRFAIAWINRGVALQAMKTAPAAKEAACCFYEALALLDNSTAPTILDRELLRAGALTNLAAALLDDPDPVTEAESRTLAQRALALTMPAEHDDRAAAEAGFKARHVLCQSIAAQSRNGQSIPEELQTLATDAVEEGLALSRHWEQRGENKFHPLAEDLFRFGCRIHQSGRPQFLADFILGNLDPAKTKGALPINQEIIETAIAALWNALREIQREGFESLATPRFEQLLQNLRDLRVAEERLLQLHPSVVT
jgi:hypothetical protein